MEPVFDSADIGRRQFWIIVAILIASIAATTAITTYILYQAALIEESARLTEMVKSRARMIESVARFDKLYSEDTKYGSAFDTTLAQIREAHDNFRGASKTGEFVLARRSGDKIEFLLNQHHSNVKVPDAIRFDAVNAEPMRRALRGASGTIIGPDYNGEIVLAAYEPIPEYGLGVVSKVDLAEIRKPFIRAALWSFAAAFVLIAIGTFLFQRIIGPMIRRIEKSREQLAEAQEIGNIGSWEWDIPNDRVAWSNQLYRIYGHNPGSIEPSYATYTQAIHPDDRSKVEKAVSESMHEGKPFLLDYRIVHPDGDIRWIHEVCHHTRNADGKAIKRYGTIQDITRRKNYEVELNQTNRELQQAMATIKTIQGVVPLCAWCNNQVRVDEKWVKLEEYLETNTDATVSHSICPNCQSKMLHDLDTLSK